MCTSWLKCLKFSIINLLCLASIVESLPVQQTGHDHDSTVVYRRYVRRRPSLYIGDSYMEEVHEVFNIRQRPPQYDIFDDNEIDQLIRCDFEPHLKECELLRNKIQNTTPVILPKIPVPGFLEPVPNNSMPTRPFSRRPDPTKSTATTTSTMPINILPLPTRPTLISYKPTPKIDWSPHITNDDSDIPTLPPISEEYDDIDVNTEKSISYEEETTVRNFDYDYYEVDPEDGDDF